MAKMTEKQKRFADEYIISLNAAEAYRKAGYNVKSGDVAKANASRLLTKANVQEYIAERMAELQKSTIATQEEVLEHLTRVMRRQEDEHQVVTLRKKTEKWVPVGEEGQLKKMTVETEETEVVPMPTRVADTNKAAELLGKRYALFTDRVDIEASQKVVIVDDIDDADDS